MRNHQSTPLWIASGNVSKTKELEHIAIMVFPKISVVTAREPHGVIEDEPTFSGNARLKAIALAEELIREGHKNFAVLGDDSGLCVDLLGGAPGVHSARYSSPQPSPQKNLEKLLHELGAITPDLEKRTGSYNCALCLIYVVEGEMVEELMAEGELRGIVAASSKGANGYAYDSVFLNPDTLQSYAEISFEEKQRGSHRRRAFEELKRLAAMSDSLT